MVLLTLKCKTPVGKCTKIWSYWRIFHLLLKQSTWSRFSKVIDNCVQFFTDVDTTDCLTMRFAGSILDCYQLLALQLVEKKNRLQLVLLTSRRASRDNLVWPWQVISGNTQRLFRGTFPSLGWPVWVNKNAY